MNSARLRARYRHIMGFFTRATASFIFWEIIASRLGLRSIARRTRSRRYQQIAAQFRAMAIRMGGVMIKVGQFLSARADVLPPEITEELSGLQDEVPAEEFESIRRLAEAEGILLDPVYTAKAMAALIDHVRRGVLDPASSVLFLHTGGTPALFAHASLFNRDT